MNGAQVSSWMKMKTINRFDDMIITFQDKGVNYGFNSINTSSIRGHLRQAYHDFGSRHELWSSLLHDVGRGLDKGSDIRYIRSIQLSGSNQQGEK